VPRQARSTLITQLVNVVADLSAMSDISQGSVATYKCGGILSNIFTANVFFDSDSKIIFFKID